MVTTIRVAPAAAISSTGASPNELARMTPSRMIMAAVVLPVCGAFPATSCHRPIMG